MPVDHYKMTMEAKPLRLLYSKYAPQALLGSGSIRPLGAVRRCSNTEHDEETISLSHLENEVSKVERVQRYLAMSGGSSGLLDMYGSRKSLHSLPVVSDSETVQADKRSRNQDFENKFKLAMARGARDQKGQNIFNKRVVHLPMLKINLETYVGETEDTKALESTRRSLRHILDTGRKPSGPTGSVSTSLVKHTGITQYHFQTPAEQQKEGQKPSKTGPNGSDQFLDKVPFVQVIRKNDERQDHEQALRLESVCDEIPPNCDSACAIFVNDVIEEQNEEGCRENILYETKIGDGDDASVVAQRLSSAATLGTSYVNSDFEPFSSETDGEQTYRGTHAKHGTMDGLVGFQNAGHGPVWPSFDDMKNLMPDYGHTSLAINPRNPREVRFLERGSSVILKRAPPDSFLIRNGVKPKLKYSTHCQRRQKKKLEPIASAPHTERECAMCNLFKVKEPTPCPPNTPRHPGDQLPEIVTTLNPDSLADDSTGPEEPDESDDETDRSDIEFRKRHRLLNYDINYIPRKLDSIERKETEKEKPTEYRLGTIHQKITK